MIKKFDRQIIRRMWAYLSPYRKMITVAILLLMISKAIEAYVPVYIGQVTNEILLGKSENYSLLINQSMSIMGLLLLGYLIDSVIIFLKNWVGQRGLFTLRSDLYQHLQRMPMAFYNQQKVGTLMTRTIHDVDKINQLFAESLVPIMGSIILFFSICICLLIIDWRVALLLALILPFVFWHTKRFSREQRRCYAMIRREMSRMNRFVQEHLLGASTIRSFGLQQEEKKQFDEINMQYRDSNVETIHHFAFFFSGIDFIQSFSLIAVFVLLAQVIAVDGAFEAGTYFTFSLYVIMLFRPLSDLADRYNLLQSALASAERIFDTLDQETEKKEGKKLIDSVESIQFEDVWFAYKEQEWVLKGLSFKLKKGESVALVGTTGAGKTTILNLLLRFYDYQKGRILINGIEITEYRLDQVRKLFGVVLQDPELFSGTIKDNIRFDDPKITDEKLEQTCRYIHLRPLLSKYPNGLDHQLTERGKDLSAGERQLISMARALAHDRSCMILDEATANIDSHTEGIIQRALKKILHSKTSLVIAHRLSTINDVDRIIVLHQGVVHESGTHTELLELNGIYEKLYRLNSQPGQEESR